MYKFMIATFLMLGWAFYEMSGGADFVPEERPQPEIVAEARVSEPEAPVTLASAVAEPTPTVETNSTEIQVARADVSDLSNLAAIPEASEEADKVAAVTAPAEEATPEVAPVTEGVELTAALPELLDLRAVSGQRVNMRSGPGTNYGVLDTLPGGTEAEVLEVDGTGWARIRILESGQVGWMAERLLEQL